LEIKKIHDFFLFRAFVMKNLKSLKTASNFEF